MGKVVFMKKQDLYSAVKFLAVPCLLILLGLILLVNPDAASALAAKILAGMLILSAVCIGISALVTRHNPIGKGMAAAVLAIAGGWLSANPLVLAAWVGRFIGALILINSGADLFYARKQGHQGLLRLGAVAVGVILLMLPMTASRVVFSLCGIAVLVIGGVMLAERLRSRRWLPEGDDPNIIDAL